MSADRWEEAFDAESGRPYYFNRLTGETSWTHPDEETTDNSANGGKVWQEAFDEVSQTVYYYNIHTGETSWTLPTSAEEYDVDLTYLTFAVIRLQSMFRGQRDRRRVVRLLRSTYQLTRDPITDQTLYTNIKTKVSSWIKPALFARLVIDNEDDDVGFDDFQDDADNDDGDLDNNDTNGDVDAEINNKMRRKYPRSKAQQRVDDAEDSSEKATVLDLSALNAWKLSSRIWNLQFLKKLVLSHNQLKRIPSGIQDLVRLEELDVSHNLLGRLPSCLQTTTSLTSLDASHNQIHAFSPKLWKLRAIHHLDLSYNELEKLPYVEGDLKLLRETREWQVGIGMLTELVSLRLSHNQLTQVPISIEKCLQLEILDLSFNRIHTMQGEIGDQQALQKLFLQNNGLISLPESCGNLVNLQKLDLSENQVTILPESIGNLQNLKHLRLHRNQLKHLPEKFGALGQLTLLEMDANVHFTRLDTFFRRLPSIKLFSATSCGIIAFDTVEFLKESPVQALRLPHNALEEFPIQFGRAVMRETLEELDLEDNRLTLFPIEILLHCHRLRFVNFSSNIIRKIPREIGQLKRLEILRLAHNQLEELPDELTSLYNLQELDVNHNALQSLPLAIGNLSCLIHMNVAFNRLCTLPTSVMKLQNLKSLYASDNLLLAAPPALFHATKCFCDFSNNPFNDVEILAQQQRKEKFGLAIKLMGESEFGSAEEVYSQLLDDINNLSFVERKHQLPQLHFCRGLCRYMLLKISKQAIELNDAIIKDCERKIHSMELLELRLRTRQKQETARPNRQQPHFDPSDDQGDDIEKLSVNHATDPHSKREYVKGSNMNEALLESYAQAAEARRVARDEHDIFADGALNDMLAAIKAGILELPTAYYLAGQLQMTKMDYMEATTSFTNALKQIIPPPTNYTNQDEDQMENQGNILNPTIPKTCIHIFLQRAEAYRRLGQLPAALADLHQVLVHHPIDAKEVEDAERKYALEWDAQKSEYFVDHETIFRAFDVASNSGLPRRPEVLDLHKVATTSTLVPAPIGSAKGSKGKEVTLGYMWPKQVLLSPSERFAAECKALSEELDQKKTKEREQLTAIYEHHQKQLRLTRDFKREIRENLQLEMEEAQQRAVEKELARLAELRRQEQEWEATELLYMQYEDEMMQWLINEEARLEMERQRQVIEAQRREEDKAVYATRLARRGGRRQQLASQRGGGTSSNASSRAGSSRNSNTNSHMSPSKTPGSK